MAPDRASLLQVGVRVVGILAVATSCGGRDAASDSPEVVTTHQDLCAGAPPEDSNHIVTAMSCPFVQHTANVVRFGVALPTPAALRDARGVTVANVTNACDSWFLGTDAQGVTVVIRRDTGDVVSHGIQHPGQALSQLSSPLPLPLAFE